MANTYYKIASVEIGAGGAANIEFTSIPSTYTDLCLRISTRSTAGAIADAAFLRMNNDTGSHSYRFLRGSGTAADSGSASSQSFVYAGQLVANTSTSNTFSNVDIYIPNYAGSSYKSVSVDAVGENNNTTAWQTLVAGLWSSTSAITSLKLYPENGPNFAQYSTAYLYGIVKQ